MSLSPENIRILYVDDEDANLLVFKLTFGRKYPVLTAISGMEALALLNSTNEKINVVISDMRMPQMTGVEFIQKAREKYPDIAYFILTGYDYNEEIERAIRRGDVLRFFTKPFDMEEIERAIYAALEESNF